MKRGLVASLSLVVLLGASACGVPQDDHPQLLDHKGTARRSSTTSTVSTPDPRAGLTAAVYFTRVDDRLVRVSIGRSSDAPTPAAVQRLLDQLAAGPGAGLQSRGYTSALPPGISLRVQDFTDGIVVVDVAGELSGTGGGQSIDAIAQVVLTATSVDAVRSVRLTRDGSELQAALADGRLTSQPLRAADYLSLVAPGTEGPLHDREVRPPPSGR